MRKPKHVLLLVLAFAVMAAIIACQQSAVNKLRDDVVALEENQTGQIQQDEDSRQRQLEGDARRAMRAICVLGEFAQMDRPAGPEQTQTIQSAEFELLYFTQQYLTSSLAGRPMVNLLLSDNEEWQQWHIMGEYYPTLDAVSISLEAAKRSTQPHIASDGNIRYLLERISSWLVKHSQVKASEQSGGEVRS